jgi:hypothetical protein
MYTCHAETVVGHFNAHLDWLAYMPVYSYVHISIRMAAHVMHYAVQPSRTQLDMSGANYLYNSA